MFTNSSHPRPIRLNLSKLRPPDAGHQMTPRHEFQRRIFSSDANLVLVSAPAGYGKSTAMALLYRNLAAQGTRVGWLTVEPSENDLGRFSQYVWLSLGSALPAFGGQATESSVVEAASETVTGRAYELLDALALSDDPLTLFIDDFEHITSPEVLAFITSLVSNFYIGQRLILGSRHKTMLPLGRLRVQGKLLELEAQELRFTPEETRLYVSSRLKLELGDEDLTHLQESTEGWAAALQLSTAALVGQANPSLILKGLAGPSRGIADYLAEDVLARLPETQRNFVITSSMFDTFCPSMCDAVFERDDSSELIEQTHRDNLFLQIIDADGSWYRYHPLFRDFLRTQIPSLTNSGNKTREWHLKAAKWLDSAGRGLQAIDHAIAGNSPELAAELMTARATDFVRTGQFGLVSHWIELLSKEVLSQHPSLAIAGAYAMVFLHRYKDATTLLAQIEPIAAGIREPAHDLLVLRVMLGAWSDDLPKAMETAVNALPSLQDASPYVIGLMRNVAAYREVAAGNYYSALQHLSIAKHALEPIKAIHGLSYSQCIEGGIEMLQGNVIQASTRFNATLSNMLQTGYRFTNSTAVAAAYLIEAQYELNDLDSAEILLADYLSLIRDCCLPDQLITSYRIAARIHFIRGRQTEALETLDYLQDLGDLRGIPRLAAAARQGKLRLALRAGDMAAANRLFLLLSANEIWEQWVGLFPYADDLDDPFIAKIRIALVSGNGAAVVSQLQEAVVIAESNNRHRRAIRLRCMLAQAFESARKRTQALELLENTLAFAESQGLFRVIADDSWLLLPLLEALELRSHRVSRNYLTSLIKASTQTNVAYIPSSVSSIGGRGPESNLSQRELQILRLVSEGSSNKELSRKLFVSENTVETHLRRIYSKLGTKNRTQAVSVAREKGFL